MPRDATDLQPFPPDRRARRLQLSSWVGCRSGRTGEIPDPINAGLPPLAIIYDGTFRPSISTEYYHPTSPFCRTRDWALCAVIRPKRYQADTVIRSRSKASQLSLCSSSSLQREECASGPRQEIRRACRRKGGTGS